MNDVCVRFSRSSLMGQGSGHGEKSSCRPPSLPSPSRAEGDLLIGGGARFSPSPLKGEGRVEGARALLIACALFLFGNATAFSAAPAETYPQRPIRLVVPFSASGGSDLVARVLGQKFAEAMGQPVIVDNRPGGGGTIGVEIVAPADFTGHRGIVVSDQANSR